MGRYEVTYGNVKWEMRVGDLLWTQLGCTIYTLVGYDTIGILLRWFDMDCTWIRQSCHSELRSSRPTRMTRRDQADERL